MFATVGQWCALSSIMYKQNLEKNTERNTLYIKEDRYNVWSRGRP